MKNWTGLVARASTVDQIVRDTRRVPGVVQVADQRRYEFDDRATLGLSLAYGVA